MKAIRITASNRRAFAWMSWAPALALAGCAVFTPSETREMQSDIREIKLANDNLAMVISDSLSKILYSLEGIEEKLDIRDRQIGSSLRDVNNSLADFSDSSARFSNNDVGISAPPAARDDFGSVSISQPVPGGGDEDLFLQAGQAWIDKDVIQAETLYRELVRAYPSSRHAGEAQFWVAECLYVQGNFREAIQIYDSVIRNYPGSEREAEAAAKIGYCYLEMNEFERATSSLNDVVYRYPDYDDIEKIKEFLATLAANRTSAPSASSGGLN